jgi:hypothetical protein
MKPLLYVLPVVVLLTGCQHVQKAEDDEPPLYFRQEGLFWIEKHVGHYVRVQGMMMAPQYKGPDGFGVLSGSDSLMFVDGSFPELDGFLVEAEGKLTVVRIPGPTGLQQGIPGGVLMYWLETPTVRRIDRVQKPFEKINSPNQPSEPTAASGRGSP